MGGRSSAAAAAASAVGTASESVTGTGSSGTGSSADAGGPGYTWFTSSQKLTETPVFRGGACSSSGGANDASPSIFVGDAFRLPSVLVSVGFRRLPASSTGKDAESFRFAGSLRGSYGEGTGAGSFAS
uniref:Putative secreted protein n=1 Tax=Ixodes ricinus TaxID=34613 RepID=A0A6B0UQY2_IXORI